MLRIIFSNEKNQYLQLKENDLKLDTSILENIIVDFQLYENFEINFMNNVIEKCVEFYYKNFGIKTQVLFRKEESYDEIIKTIFLSYGGYIFQRIYAGISPFMQENSIEFKKDHLYLLIDNIVEILITQCPMIIRIILKIIYDKVKLIYSISTYEPLLVVIFFNFLFNPKLQSFHGFNITNEKLRNISMIIYKACFNTLFNSSDKLAGFNPFIEEINKKLILCMECVVEKINQMDIKDVNKYLINEIYIQGIIQPEMMFYVDCDFLMKIFDNIKLISLRTDSIHSEKTFNSRESFYVNFDKEKASEIKVENEDS